MFFILSKVLLFLLQPLTWLVILLLLNRFYFKAPKWKRVSKIAFICIAILFSNGFLYNLAMINWQPAQRFDEIKNKHYQVGVLLCGMTYLDKDDVRYFATTSDRFLQTVRLYKLGVIDTVFVSGGSGSLDQSRPREADFLRNQLITFGVDQSRILVENQSRNTYESAVKANDYIGRHKADSILIITSAIHMPRSRAVFRKQGYNTAVYPCNYTAVKFKMSLKDILIPNPEVLMNWQYLMKEIVGYGTYKITGKI